MSSAVVGRWMWKEYRTLRAFWISLAALAVLMQLAPLVFSYFGRDSTGWIFGIALAIPAFYAVACGATMFAGEHEEGTYEFVRALPVTAREILGGKLAHAAASTLLLIATLWLMAFAVCRGELPTGQTHLELWGLWGLAAIEALAWAMLFSLLLKRPLSAAMLGIAATSVSIYIAIAVWVTTTGAYQLRDLGPYVAAIPVRAVIAVAVLLADIRLAGRWLQPEITSSGGLFRQRRHLREEADWAQPVISFRPSRAAILVRLVWQSWRQSAVMIATLAGLGAAVILLFPFHSVFDSETPRIPVIVLVASLMGSCVFLADQEGRRVRFFAEQGIPPRYVWLARQLVWFSALAIWAAIVHALWFAFTDGSSLWRVFRSAVQRQDQQSLWALGAFLVNLPPFALAICFSIFAFSAGQLASMFLRSGILSGFVGLVLTGALGAWILLMDVLEVSWLWSVAPIPCVLFFATWLRTPDWILERNGPRAWLRVGAALAVPAAALLVAVPVYRVYQIPFVWLGFTPERFAQPITPEERETADLYRRAGESLMPSVSPVAASEALTSDSINRNERSRPPDAAELAALEANGECLAMLLEASGRTVCSFFDLQRGTDAVPSHPYFLVMLLDISARERESAGNLDEAWVRYVAALRLITHLRKNATSPWRDTTNFWESQIYGALPLWAAQPGQTSARIAAAIKQLEELEASQPPASDAIKADYLLARRLIAGGLATLAESGLDPHRASQVARWTLVPGERSRALRLLRVNTAQNVLRLDAMAAQIAGGQPIDGSLPRRYDQSDWRSILPGELTWWRTTYLLQAYYDPEIGIRAGWELLRLETRRRATRLLLAIKAWKLDHGELPHSLTELVGPYFVSLPLDLYNGRPFRYYREGLAMPPELLANSESSNWPRPPQKPFIWSGGEKAEYQIPRDTDIADATVAGLPVSRDDFSIRDETERWNSPSSKYVLFLSGQWFEIP